MFKMLKCNNYASRIASRELIAALTSIPLALSCLPASADTHDKVEEFVKSQVQLKTVDEGTRSRCITEVDIVNVCVRRDTWQYWTIPEEINVSVGRAVDFEGEMVATGTITYNFNCRERRKRYDAGIETDTNDSHRAGSVVADFSVTFGELSISNVRREKASGYCGNSIMARMVSY